MSEIAAAAGVGRSTHLSPLPDPPGAEGRAGRDVRQAGRPRRKTGPHRLAQIATMPFQAAGLLGREVPLALEVTRILDEVPPHLVPDQLVAEARRAAGVAVALYVVDIDGSHLLRLAGSPEFPERIENPPALGPEIVPEGLADFYEQLQRATAGMCR